MPLTQVECCGFDCPVTPEQCVEHAAARRNSCNFTAELLAALYDTVQDRGERITTTALLTKCLRQEHLTRTEEYTVKPMDLWAAFRGTMFHHQLEKYGGDGCIAEPRYYVELEGLGELTGSPDLIDVERGYLFDYKNTKSPPRFGKPWDNHSQQNNINRWLVDHAHTVEFQGELFDLTDVDNRARFVPVDWQKLIIVYMNDEGPAPLECTKSIQVPKKSGEGTKAARVPDIWDDDFAEAFIRNEYGKAHAALVERELPPIPQGFEHQSHVLCNYCAKRARCRELELQEILAA